MKAENNVDYEVALPDFLSGEHPFSQGMFCNIPSCFATVYTWVWNTKISKEKICEKIDIMFKNKIRAFYILPEPCEFRPDTMKTLLHPEYLSDEFFELVRYAIEYAENNGMYCWLYDEGGWPSGSACKRIKSDWHSLERTREFIESTHVPYAKALSGCHPGLMFTDEPKADNFSGMDFNEATEAFTASLREVAEFCHLKGWLFGGHLDNDHKSAGARFHGYGSALQCLQVMDIPGVDAIGWQIASDNSKCKGFDGDMPFFPRVASSAASQTGHALALSENFAVYGNAVSPDEMRWIIGSQLVRGINLFNFMLMPFDDELWFPLHERSNFTPAMPGFGNLHALTAEFERAAYFTAHGKPETDIALVFPDKEVWNNTDEDKIVVSEFCKLGAELENQGVDFDIIDEKTILKAEISNGVANIGHAAYRKIITASGQKISVETDEIINSLSGESKSSVETSDFSIWKKVRRDENGNIFVCLFNHGSEAKETAVNVKTDLPLYLFDAKSGKAYHFENGSKICIPFGGIILILATKNYVKTDEKILSKCKIKAKPVGMRKKKELILSKDGARLVDCENAELLPINEDFAKVFGKGFSGEVEYEYSFTLEKDCKILITAQMVEDTAEIKLNGEKIGYFTTSPYEVEALGKYGENRLAITVSNPAANAFTHFDAEKYFTPAEIGPYHKRTLAYEKENCRGGIKGQVEIYY